MLSMEKQRPFHVEGVPPSNRGPDARDTVLGQHEMWGRMSSLQIELAYRPGTAYDRKN
jgi:hypothetical protein